MAYFGDRLLDEIRAALPVLRLVERFHKMRKRSASEYVAIDDNSLTVNSAKNIWNDFSKQRGGDIFEFLNYKRGATFEDAVTECAGIAGVRLPPAASGPRRSAPLTNGGHGPEEPPLAAYTNGGGGAPQPARKPERKLVATYPFLDADSVAVYETARFEWMEEGKRRKAVLPRRRAGDAWVWGIKEGDYLRGRNGDWYSAAGRENWKNAERRSFDEVHPTLYRLPEVLEEGKADPSEQRVIFLPEGEKAARVLEEWGLLSTTNSGGTSGWRDVFADYLKDCDVVIQADNDSAGRKFAALKAASLHKKARRVRLLDWRYYWPGCPDKGDVANWRDSAGGTPEKLFEILDLLQDWQPGLPESAFGAQRYIDIDKPAAELSWLIKGVMTRGEVSIWFGQWGSGKSFLITDAAMAIARDAPWMNLRTHFGLVVYQAGEGGLGLRRRLRAYRDHHRLAKDENIPFVLLPSRIDIFSSEADVDKLIAEVNAWASWYGFEHAELVVLDTLNASSPGAEENNSKDMGLVMNRARRIALACRCHVALVDHTPKDGGSPRGWSGKMGNVDSAVSVTRSEVPQRVTHADGRTSLQTVREWTVAKQKDEADRVGRSFVLSRVVLGRDGDGDDITSCVVEDLGAGGAPKSGEVPAGWATIIPANVDIFRALVAALERHGQAVPEGVEAPAGCRVVEIKWWQEALLERWIGHEDVTQTLKNRIRKKIQRACDGWSGSVRLIGKHKEFVWRTDRKAWPIDPPPPVKREVLPLLAPGEIPDDLQWINR